MVVNPTKNSARPDKKFSRIYAESDGDEIVISGMSGRFPNSRNVAEFEHNLYNKIDMLDEAEIRWKHFDQEIPRKTGTVSDLEKFDAPFFGVHYKQAHTMDPQGRILIEAAFESIIDAGMCPKAMQGSRTGVYVGSCICETEKVFLYEPVENGGFGITGCSRAMLANRISYSLDLVGPSFLVDSASSSSLYALNAAFTAFRNGEIDAAIVGGANIMIDPNVSLQYSRLGVSSPDGNCRPFDKDANGYARSESVNCIFLQRKRDAKRIYCTLMYSDTNYDGYKSEGIVHASSQMEEKLLQDFYANVPIHVNDLGYLETSSSGKVMGDPEECRAIDKAICSKREKSLLVGSVKSNAGHAEAASGLNSIVKMCLAFQNGKIAPNINFTTPNPKIPALIEGRIQVVSEVQDLKTPYAGISSFGLAGANAHALVMGHTKEKINFGIPKDGLPRLVNFAGRTEDTVTGIFDSVAARPLDAEYIGLLHNTQTDPHQGLVYRGYALFGHEEGKNAQCLTKDVQHFTGSRRPVVFVFSGMGSQWPEMGSSLMNLPMFRESIERCHKALTPKGLDLIKILTSPDPKTFDNILHSFVGIAACQIAIVDMLRVLGIEADYYIGHSVGELGCGYADGGFTPEQMILSSYSRGIVSLETEKIKGSMAAVGLGFKEITKILPQTIEVACHNSQDSSTISGPAEDVAKFVGELKEKGVFAKEVPCSNIAYHSRYIAEMGPALLKRLKEIIPQPKERSKKWLSSSIPKARWDNAESQFCSAEYHTNNLLKSVLFEETAVMLPPNAITIEIAPHGLLQAILKRSMPEGIHVGLTYRGHKNNMNFFLTALGKLFINGVTMRTERLHPPVEFPVSCGTPMLSSLMKWDHSADWLITKYENIRSDRNSEKSYQIGIDSAEYLEGYMIDGKVLVPATEYLLYVWKTLCLMKDEAPSYIDTPVEFEDVRFIRPTQVSKDEIVTLSVVIHYGSGYFEISENGDIVVTGTIREIEYDLPMELPPVQPSDSPVLNSEDFYKELHFRGHQYGATFRNIEQIRADGQWAKVKWDNNWVTFMDSLLQTHLIGNDTRSLLLPTGFRNLRINGKYHYELLNAMDPENLSFEVRKSKDLDRIACGGVEITGLKIIPVARRRPTGIPVLERYQFIPHFPSPQLDESDAVRCCVQLMLENDPLKKIKIVEHDSTGCGEPIISHFVNALDDAPVITSRYSFLTSQEIKLPGVLVDNSKLSGQKNCNIIIAKNMLRNNEYIVQVQKSLAQNGFFLAREKAGLNINDIQAPFGFHRFAVFPTEKETLILMMRLRKKFFGEPTMVFISDKDSEFQWMEKVKTCQTKGPVLMVTQNEKFNGILGLVNCLRKEPNGHLISCMIIDDPNATPFDHQHPFYKKQLNMAMAINIFKNGNWGTYRHIHLNQDIPEKPHTGFVEANIRTVGDLSSLDWFETTPFDKYADCVYASLNIRDVMVATGRLEIENRAQDSRKHLASGLGYEYVGITKDGRRVMVIIPTGAFSMYQHKQNSVEIEIPDNMSMKDAATILVAYLTVYYAFFGKVDIRKGKGKSILIHSGTSGVGLAAIRVALAYGLEVFTTCSTSENKEYLLKTFPTLKESHIGSSRDTSFENMVLLETNGEGVDFVLNSLSGDKVLASVRCLGFQGHFLEIGKFDFANNLKIDMGPFLQELTFHPVMVDNFYYMNPEEKACLTDMIKKDIEKGIVKPLPSTVFKANEIEKAFRYLAAGRHIGKVLLQIREDENSNCTLPIKVMPTVNFDKDLVYVIPGGLGGFGLELADWLILRGATKIVLSSSRGVTKSYQKYKLHMWKTSYGANVVVNTADITTRDGCEKLLRDASEMGQIGGIFNLAVKLQDAVFQNQSVDKFKESFGPKAVATKYLDELSRKMCPNLTHFVVFSSVSCGRGNAGQTNYGMANSIMERIIEDRVANGLPGKAIQWGAVGEVGLVADMTEENVELEIGETLQQSISSCLEELGQLLSCPDPIVCSMVVAERRSGARGTETLLEIVMNIIGIRDLKSISMEKTLSELGMDSLMASEIKTKLERDFELSISPLDLCSLTFEKLKEYSGARQKEGSDAVKLNLEPSTNLCGMNLLIKRLGDEETSANIFLPLMTKSNRNIGNPIIILPGLEGIGAQIWYEIADNLNSKALLLQFNHTAHMTSLMEVADVIFEDVKKVVDKGNPFYIVSYSFSTFITIEVVKRLEKAGYHGQLVFIDGAPHFLKKLCFQYIEENPTDEEILNCVFTGTVSRVFSDETVDSLEGWDKTFERFAEYAKGQNLYSTDYCIKMIKSMFNRIKMTIAYDTESIEEINTPITLIRSSQVSVVDIDEDFELSKITKGTITVKFIKGEHMTIMENPKLPQIINETHPGIARDKHLKR